MIETLFVLSTAFAVGGWAFLIFRPSAKGIAKGVAGILSAGYLAALIYYYSGGGGYPASLDALMQLVRNPTGLLAMWLHYLAVDLIAGIWQTSDAETIGMEPWRKNVCLLLTMVQGPAGILLYMFLRRAKDSSVFRVK